VPFVAIPNTAKVVVTFQHPTRPQCEIVTHWRDGASAGPYSVANMIGLANALMTALAARYTGSINQFCSVLEATATDVTVATGNQGVSTHAVIPGVDTGAVTPSSTCFCVSLRTGTRSRRARGRIYMPCMSTHQLTNAGLWDPTETTAIATVWGQMSGDVFTATGFAQAVASRLDAVSREVLEWSGNVIPRTQRRREEDH
jgi:hypothetical protein